MLAAEVVIFFTAEVPVFYDQVSGFDVKVPIFFAVSQRNKINH